MRRSGIGEEDLVVVYDAANGSHAVRLWWMLTVIDHRAAVLDGGLASWQGPRETGPPTPRPAKDFISVPWPDDAVVEADEVRDALAVVGARVLDARAPERYRGEVEPFDDVAGHIPGALNVPWTANLEPASGRFLPADVLKERYRGLGADNSTIVHCGSGITGPHDALAMRLAGLPMPRLYVGSWSDWISDPDRPVATGKEP